MPARDLFRAVSTQWRVGGMGVPTGLDYAGVRAAPAFRRIPRKQREQVFQDLCDIEEGWLGAQAEALRRRAKQPGAEPG